MYRAGSSPTSLRLAYSCLHRTGYHMTTPRRCRASCSSTLCRNQLATAVMGYRISGMLPIVLISKSPRYGLQSSLRAGTRLPATEHSCRRAIWQPGSGGANRSAVARTSAEIRTRVHIDSHGLPGTGPNLDALMIEAGARAADLWELWHNVYVILVIVSYRHRRSDRV